MELQRFGANLGGSRKASDMTHKSYKTIHW
jgi:hypothetical protein